MDQKIQILYTKLTQEDRDKVDAKIHELFAKRREQHMIEICSNVQQQDDRR